MSNLLKIKEVADMLGCKVGLIYSMIRTGNLPAIRIGSSWRIRRKDAEDIPISPHVTKTPYFLVVDDDPAGQEILRLMLKDLKVNRVLVGNLEDAITALRRRRFAAIFLDEELSGGFQVIRFAREIDPNYPVILVRRNKGKLIDHLLRYGPVTMVSSAAPSLPVNV
jgi:excisionase family DNA binding protein